MKGIYLDHAATTPVDPRVTAAMLPFFSGTYGNASSIHRFGQEARAGLDGARAALAAAAGVRAAELTFVSGGTEADNALLIGAARALRRSKGRGHIVTAAAEHHAVLEPLAALGGEGWEITILPVDGSGMVDPDAVRKAVTPSTAIVSVMAANNETGTINPVGAIAAVAREAGALFHTDAVQAFGKVPFDGGAADLVAISAHKIYGPKGIGAMIIRRGCEVDRFLHGGGQEGGRRAGTENTALAAGFAAAAGIAAAGMAEEALRLEGLRSHFRQALADRFPAMLFNGHPTASLPHIVNVSFDARRIVIDGEALLFNLDLRGIAVTSGSACTSGSMEPSHVLLAMGRDERTARASIRFSMGRGTTRDDLDRTVDALDEVVRLIGSAPR